MEVLQMRGRLWVFKYAKRRFGAKLEEMGFSDEQIDEALESVTTSIDLGELKIVVEGMIKEHLRPVDYDNAVERAKLIGRILEKAIILLDDAQMVPAGSEKSEFEWEQMDTRERRDQWLKDLQAQCEKTG